MTMRPSDIWRGFVYPEMDVRGGQGLTFGVARYLRRTMLDEAAIRQQNLIRCVPTAWIRIPRGQGRTALVGMSRRISMLG